MLELFDYNNVFFDSKSDYKPNEINEIEYCKTLFKHLEHKLTENFKKINFFILFSHNPDVFPESFAIKDKNKVLLWFSEESGKFPIHLSIHYALIFKSYIKKESLNIYANPLGYVNGFENFPEEKMNKITNLFFSGNLNDNRKALYELFFFRKRKMLKVFQWLPFSLPNLLFFKLKIKNLSTRRDKSLIFFSEKFKGGLSYSEYLGLMKSSKYVLCPQGFQSNETFRHIEAISNKCIVISGKMPDVSIYKDHPFLVYENMQELNCILNKIASNEYDQKSLLDRHDHYYQQRLSVDGASSHIAEKCALMS